MIENHYKSGTALELFVFISIGSVFFFVNFVHLGFFFGAPLTKNSLWIFLLLYLLGIVGFIIFKKEYRRNLIFGLTSFVLLVLMSVFVAMVLGRTFDTSWDGQGYQQSGIINLYHSWNPVRDGDLVLVPPDGGIFVKGYPKALWVVQSGVYLISNTINSAKVSNFFVFVVAVASSYFLLRTLKIDPLISGSIALAVSLQAPFLMQALTFMADGYSYQILLVTITGLGYFSLSSSPFSMATAFMGLALLADTKYSNLPIVAVGATLLLLIVIFKKIRNHYSVSRTWIVVAAILSSILLAVPYVTNQLYYNYPFYPTNLKEVSATFHDDNTPKNLRDSSSLTLLFFGIFGKAQTELMGKDSVSNVGELKMPFTFTRHELMDSAFVFNNRVGSMGPLFSGTILLSFLLLVLFFVVSRHNDRLLLVSIRVLFTISVFIMIALVNPVPNLSRYNSQLVLVPFLILIVSMAWFRMYTLVKIISFVLFFAIIGNSSLYVYSVVSARIKETVDINHQLSALRLSPIEVQTDHFYSNLVRLNEGGIQYTQVKSVSCKNPEFLIYTSYTTKFCRNY